MIKDLKGRKWFLRFKQYRQGWYWEAKCDGKDMSQSAGMSFFKTKALAEADAHRRIPGSDGLIISRQKLPYEDLYLKLAGLYHQINNELVTCNDAPMRALLEQTIIAITKIFPELIKKVNFVLEQQPTELERQQFLKRMEYFQ